MYINCFAFLGFSKIEDVYKLGIDEYFYMMLGYQRRKLEKERDMHWQAWLNQSVQSVEVVGKEERPMFNNFDEFFNFDEKIEEFHGRTHIEKEKENDRERKKRLARIAYEANQGSFNR